MQARTARARGVLERAGMRTTHWVSSFVMLGAALAACGGQTSGLGGGGGTGSVSGTVGGTSFQVASAVAAITSETSESTCNFGPDGGQSCVSTSSGQVVAVVLTNRADATCAFVQSQAASNGQTTFANFDALLLAVGTANGDVAPGTYDIASTSALGTTTAAMAQLETTSSSCAPATVPATGGTITLTQAGPGEVAGSYTVTFAQGTFTGSFDVETCTLPDAGSQTSFDAGPPVCKP